MYVADQAGPRGPSVPQMKTEAEQAWAEHHLEHGLVQPWQIDGKLLALTSRLLSNWKE
jgi:hypothetical protein